MRKIEEIRKATHDVINEFYKKLKGECDNYGELVKKIENTVLEEKWINSAWGTFVEKELKFFYKEDVRSLPVSSQTTDNPDYPG